MKRLVPAFALLASFAASGAAAAAERTLVFAVENMTCASCPYMVRKTMAAVSGVRRVQVSLETMTATVTFDDAKTTADAIAAASAGAGYPARPQQTGG